jgi:NAD(P)H dehydrogenase (quinone)
MSAKVPSSTLSKPILVTGAAGRVGSTGMAVVKELLRRQLPVRAMVREVDERSEALATLGAQIVVANFTDYASLSTALDGVETAFFCYPVADGIAEATGLFAAAGREHGLKRVVNMSVSASGSTNPSPHGRGQWVSERILDWAGFECIHLRIDAFFHELLFLQAQLIQSEGVIRNSHGDVVVNWISGEDSGLIAASLLADPDQTSESVLYPTGSEKFSYGQVAELITSIVGRPVRYEEITPEAYREVLDAVLQGKNPRAVNHLVSQTISLRENLKPLPTNDLTARFIGREPRTIRDFILDNKDALTPRAS